MRSPETDDLDGRERLEGGPLDHVTGGGVEHRAVAGAVELRAGCRDHALLVRADRTERHHLAGGRLRDQARALR